MKRIIPILLLAVCPMLATTARAGVKPKPVGHSTGNHIADKTYNIADHGAKGDGTTLNTTAIQATIDECAKKGGTVVVPKGVFLTGALFLKPGVNLEIQEEAVLKGSQNIEDYPKGMTRIEGHFEPWRSALINGDKVDHLRISGKGTLDGNGAPFWKLFYDRRNADNKTTNLSVERPRLMFIRDSKDIKISGIHYLNSGFWNLHLYHNQKVVVENCTFNAPNGRIPDHAPSSDGIDVDSSQDVEISNCTFSVGDDDIALKGSKGPFAMDDKDSPPDENIYIHDCVFEAGGGVLTCGSEATIVRHVRIERCTARNVNVLQLKLRPDTPQDYEDINIKDITMEGTATLFKVAPWSQYFDLKGQEPPKSVVKNITINGVKGTGASMGNIKGNPLTTFGTITVKNVDLQVRSAIFAPVNFDGLKFENVNLNGSSVTPTVMPATPPAPAKQ